MKAEIALNNITEKIAEWGAINGPTIAECHEEKEELMTFHQFLLGAELGDAEERISIRVQIQEVNERLANLLREREKLVSEEADLSTDWKRKKAKLSAFLKTKNNKRYTKPVKARFEQCLRRFGIDYAAYHGGDLVGNDCRKLMGRAEEIMAEVEAMLLAVADEKGKSDETKEAISCRCCAIRDALVVFDSVFAIMFKRNADVTMERDLPRLKELLDKALVAWCNLKDKNERGAKNITPKVHGLIQHLPHQFEMYGGLGDFDEQFVERNHQTGKKDRVRSRNMRHRPTKFKSMAFWEATRKTQEVVSRGIVVNESRKRNFKGERKATAKEEASKMRESNRRRIIENIQPRDLSGESARILALAEVSSEYNPNEEDIDYDHVNDGGGGGGVMDDDVSDDGDAMDVVGGENI